MAKAAKVQEKRYMVVIYEEQQYARYLTEEKLKETLEELLEDYDALDIEIFLDSPLPFTLEKKIVLHWK